MTGMDASPALPATIRLGPVRLQIADLDRSLAFYRGVLGLRVLAHEAGQATLGATADDRPLVELVERPEARPVPRGGRLGLYHYALLVPDRAALGRFLRHATGLGLRPGASDHLVSEALYLHDPDGLGIEVYADRPREGWRRRGRELMMATDPVDVAAVVAAGGDGTWTGLPEGTTMGHVHLHVGDLVLASRFYSEALGLDRMVWSYPGALFLSAGGYHHHLATNLWAGSGARPPEADEAQLLEWSMALPEAASMRAVTESLVQAGFDAEPVADAIRTRDPWGTALRLFVESPSGGGPEAQVLVRE
jgi:catechol 2,3-dioxygenase